MILNILEQLILGHLSQIISKEFLEAEATKIAFHHRNKYLGDPKFTDIPVEKLYVKIMQKN